MRAGSSQEDPGNWTELGDPKKPSSLVRICGGHYLLLVSYTNNWRGLWVGTEQ